VYGDVKDQRRTPHTAKSRKAYALGFTADRDRLRRLWEPLIFRCTYNEPSLLFE
jgi:hypothetical protein